MKRVLLLIVSCSSLVGMERPTPYSDPDIVESIVSTKRHILGTLADGCTEVQTDSTKRRNPLPPIFHTHKSPLAKYILTIRKSAEPSDRYDELEVFDSYTGKSLFCKPTNLIYFNQFSPDDSYLAVIKDNTVEIISPSAGQIIYRFASRFPLTLPSDLKFLPDSKIAYLDMDYQSYQRFHITFVDLLKKEVIATVPGKSVYFISEKDLIRIIQREDRSPDFYHWPSLKAAITDETTYLHLKRLEQGLHKYPAETRPLDPLEEREISLSSMEVGI